jgi:RNA polymerase sigma-70 factor, ECF subfamily
VKNLVIENAVAEFYAPLYRFALALVNNQAEAADLTQETFLILCKQRRQLRKPEKIKSWLFTTLRGTFLKAVRLKRVCREIELPPQHQVGAAGPPIAFRSVEAKAILNALGGLGEEFRVTLELFYIAELSYKEIANKLQIPIGTVMSRLSRGKEHLRDVLAQSGEEIQ